MRKCYVLLVLIVYIVGGLGLVCAGKDNLNGCVNVGKHASWNYDYNVTFYDSQQKKLYKGNCEESDCNSHRHVRVPDEAFYYKVWMKPWVCGATAGETDFISAKYVSKIDGRTYANSGIFTGRGALCCARCYFDLEEDVGRDNITSQEFSDGFSGMFKIY